MLTCTATRRGTWLLVHAGPRAVRDGLVVYYRLVDSLGHEDIDVFFRWEGLTRSLVVRFGRGGPEHVFDTWCAVERFLHVLEESHEE